jgi:hypothetical protein
MVARSAACPGGRSFGATCSRLSRTFESEPLLDVLCSRPRTPDGVPASGKRSKGHRPPRLRPGRAVANARLPSADDENGIATIADDAPGVAPHQGTLYGTLGLAPHEHPVHDQLLAQPDDLVVRLPAVPPTSLSNFGDARNTLRRRIPGKHEKHPLRCIPSWGWPWPNGCW